jgi:hypothetical protein
MDIQDFVPAGGGSLRGRAVPEAEPVATFTPTQTVHPDEYWHPWGGELDAGRAPSLVSSADDQAGQRGDARPGRPGTSAGDGYSFQTTARMVRSALRGQS